MPAGYVALNTGNSALSAATAKTIVNVINGTNALIRITQLGVSFDGTSATAVPVVVELCKSTQAGAGTSTAFTIIQERGPTRTVQATAAVDYSAEPTVLTVIRTWLVHPQSGITVPFYPGREPEQTTSVNALCLRCTAPAIVNARGFIEFEEG
jgi:hypothetical protein